MVMRCKGVVVASTTCFLLSACMLGPNYHPPAAPTTQRYLPTHSLPATVSTQNAGSAGNSQSFIVNRDIPGQWWHVFHSRALDDLVAQGIANSPSLGSAQEKLQEAKKYLDEQFSLLMLPSVNGELVSKREQNSGVLFGSPQTAGSVFNIYGADLQGSYVLDLFGKNRRTLESLRAQVDYTRYQLIGAYLSLTSNIVTTVIMRAQLMAQIQATQKLIQEQAQQLKIVTAQYHVGGTSEADVYNQQTMLAQTQASLPPLQQQLAIASHELSLLLGEDTSRGHFPYIALNDLHLPSQLPVSLPSHLVKQRPDIEESQALMHSASAEIGVATAQMFPQITLTGQYGAFSTAVNDLFTPQAAIWNIGADLMQPVFYGGALFSAREQKVAAYKAAVYEYQEVLLTAFKDVADALTAIQNDAQLFQKRKYAEQFALSSLRISQKQYQLQAISYNTLLIAEQQYQKTAIDSIQAQANRYKDTTALFQALGGGWWNTTYDDKYLHKLKSALTMSPPAQTKKE